MNTRKTPEGWHVVKIKDIFDRVRNPVEVDPERNYTQIGIRSHGKGVFYKEPVTGEQLGNKSVFWVEPDCFIVNIVFAWEMAVARTTNKDKGYIASHRFPMYRPKQGILDLDFITYLFKSPRGKYLLNLASPGGAGRNKTLGQKEFEESEILIPQNIEEQKRIATVLSTWDKAIELKENLIEQKKEQKKGLIKKLLTGEIRLSGFEGKWSRVKLIDITKGKGKYGINAPSVEKSSELPTYLRITDINDEGYVQKEGLQSVNHSDSNAYFLEEGDIVFARTGASTGRAYLYDKTDGRLVFAGFLIKFSIDINKAIPEYLRFCTQTEEYREWVKVMSMRSGQPGINAEEYAQLQLNLPPLKEQMEIANILSCINRETLLLKSERAMLFKQKKALMQQLLTGKIRVKV